MHRHITRALCTAAAAAVTLGTLGLAGAGSPATAAARSISPPGYSPSWAGYSVGGGRWFRYITTTVTVPPIEGGSGVDIGLSHGLPVGEPFAELSVEQGGGSGSVRAHVSPEGYGTLPLSPRVGDQLAVSIYYDQHGHDYFTASDTTQHITRTIRLTTGRVVYNHGFVIGVGGWPGGTALVSLAHNGGATPRPYADITVAPGGGKAGISYATNDARGTFAISPAPGDQVTVSIFYDQNGHYSFTAADTTQGSTQTVSMAAPYAASMPLNSAEVLVMFSNSTVIPPPTDTQVWQFTDNLVTTYRGDHGTMIGPWATSRWVDTTDGTRTGAVVADASVLSNTLKEVPYAGQGSGHDFSVWLRHR